MDDRIALLERVPSFAGVDHDKLAKIASLTQEEDVAAGTILTHEGRHEGYFYLVVAGKVEVSRGGVVVDTSGNGSFIGEISMLDAGPRTATATALTLCLLLKVNNRGFEALLEADPSVREALEAEMARRLERTAASTSAARSPCATWRMTSAPSIAAGYGRMRRRSGASIAPAGMCPVGAPVVSR